MSASTSLRARLGRLELEHPLLVAAGCVKTSEEVERMARAPVSAVTLGSVTLLARSGNSGNVYHGSAYYALNSLGLPNRGLGYVLQEMPRMLHACHAQHKPLVVSVAGFEPSEYEQMAALLARAGADGIELNLSCPNLWEGSDQKRIACFDPQLTAHILRRVSRAVRAETDGCALGVKLSPFSDPLAMLELAEVLNGGFELDWVSACNTFPNGLSLDEQGRPRLDVRYGGVSGRALLPVALGQVSQWRAMLHPDISLCGTGGVRDGHSLQAHLNAGADAVAAATLYWEAGEQPGAFADVLADWIELEQHA